MAADPLTPVLRLRGLARDAALSDLAEALRAEAAAEQHVARRAAEIATETEQAAALTGGDADVEAFGRWLTGARARLAEAEAVRDAATGEVALARAILTATRAAMRAAEALADRRAEQARAADAAEEQRALDEIRPAGEEGQ